MSGAAFSIDRMGAADAAAVADWRYEPPYDVYNTPREHRDETIRLFLDPRYAYHAVRRAGELVGFCCFGADARVPGGDYRRDDLLDVGLGRRPDLTGQGLGLGFVRAVRAFAAASYAPAGLRLTVAAFNRRAIRVYERAGFRVVHVFERPGADGAARGWVQMTAEPDAG